MSGHDAWRDRVLAELGRIAPEAVLAQIDPARPLRDQVDLDSMDWLNLLDGLSQALSITIAPQDLPRLDTLDAIVAYLGGRAPSAPTEVDGELPCRHLEVAGQPVTLRPMRADDRPLEAAFVGHLSPETRYQRFMVTMNGLSEHKLDDLTQVDQQRHVALVAEGERGGEPALLGVARYFVDPDGRGCEFAIAIDDAWHGTGLAGILMQALIGVARSRGLTTMDGLVLRSNIAMLRFARQLGFQPQDDPGDRDTVRVRRTL